MAKLDSGLQPYPDDLFDFMGKKIEPGAKIVYASLLGRSARLTLGEVVGVFIPSNASGYSSYKFTIKVQPIKDSTGGDYRFKDWKYDQATKKGEHVDREARPVFLHFSDRLMVLDNASSS